MNKRTTYDKNFKAKVALEALQENQTIQEQAIKYAVHPNQIIAWKKYLQDHSDMIFERPNKKDAEVKQVQQRIADAEKLIGKLTIEQQFLKEKYRQIYGKDPF